jgi:hypothetical protein
MTIYHFIYKTTNAINGKYYLGVHSTKNLDDGYLGSGTVLKAAISKYGRSSFVREILQFFPDRSTAFLAEAALISDEMVTNETSYNICKGGQGAVGSLIPDYNTKARMAAAQKAAYAEGRRGSNKGKKLGPRNPEIYVRIAETKRVRNIDPSTRLGKTHTAATKRAISQASLSRPKSTCINCGRDFTVQNLSPSRHTCKSLLASSI